MKTHIRIMAVIMALFMLLVPSAIFAASGSQQERKDSPREISIIFSHDMHSHMDSERAVSDGKQIERGGMGRTATIIKQITAEYPNSWVVDGGDFSMGTAYQTVFETEASELRVMGAMGYDATTFGNHEFDYGAAGLASMLNSAKASNDKVPALLCANLDWETSLAEAKDKEATQALKDACEVYGVQEYTIIEKDGIKMAVFGIMGNEAASFAPVSGVYFSDPVEASQKVVKKIQKNEDADVIVCLSHSGTWENPEESEDEILAEQVPEINVIVSGHTHTELPEAIMVGDTAVVSCGPYNYNLGHVVLEEQKDGSFALKDYKLIPVDESVEEDQEIVNRLSEFRKTVSEEYFGRFGYEMDQVLASNDIEFMPFEEFGLEKGEEPLGNLIADSYVYAVAKAEGPGSDPIDVAVVPHGVVRGSFFTGDITVSDAFNVSSLGQGPDGISGYPLVSAYLTGKELKDLAEVDATVSDLMSVARLYMSGLSFDYNMHRMFLNRATDVQLVTADGSPEELDDEQLYRLTADLYSCRMLSIVKEQSFGLLSLEPKDAEGNPITNFEDNIIYDGDRELKAWYALASYVDSFDNNQVPEKYAQPENRKNDVTGWNPVELVKQPNKVGYIMMAAVMVLILLIIGIVKAVKRIRRKSKGI